MAAGILHQYVRDVGRTPMLTLAEEQELGRRVRDKHPDAEQARDHLIRANLRLVMSIANRFVNRGLSYEDLVAEGNIGLMRCIETFDPDRGRLSTYATWAVSTVIYKAISDHGSLIRIPAQSITLLRKWRAAERALFITLNRLPSHEQTQEYLGWTPATAAIAQAAHITLQMNCDLTPNEHNEPPDLSEFIPDRESTPPDTQLDIAEATARMMRHLDKLDRRYQRILKMRYGIDSPPMTQTEIGTVLAISKERVRQLELRAIVALRRLSTLDILKDTGPQ